MSRLYLAPAIAALLLTGAVNAQETAAPRCDYGEMHAAAPPETSQFSFLIGDFVIHLHQWQGSGWSKPQPGVTARWNGWYGLNGMAVVDEWYNPDPAQKPDGPRGVNVRMYDPEAEEWDMMWIATGARQVQDLRAKMIDGVLTMWQVYPERADFKATFHIEDDDHWRRVTYAKDEKGDWAPTFMLAATRISCGA